MFRGRVLVADDDFSQVRQVVSVLERGGFYVEFAQDGIRTLEMLLQDHGTAFDCAVLDIDMPGKSGLEVLEELRATGSAMPVLLLTDLTGETDAVRGFNEGADDYMGKPLRGRELVARVQRLVRTSSGGETPITVGDAVFSLRNLKVSGPSGSAELSYTEGELVKPLLGPPGRLVTQAELLVAGWGSSDRRNVRSLYEHVRRLRRRLQGVGSSLDVKSVRNAGYRLE